MTDQSDEVTDAELIEALENPIFSMIAAMGGRDRQTFKEGFKAAYRDDNGAYRAVYIATYEATYQAWFGHGDLSAASADRGRYTAFLNVCLEAAASAAYKDYSCGPDDDDPL